MLKLLVFAGWMAGYFMIGCAAERRRERKTDVTRKAL